MKLTLEESTSNANKYHSTSSDAEKLNKSVAYFIAKDAFPVFPLWVSLDSNIWF